MNFGSTRGKVELRQGEKKIQPEATPFEWTANVLKIRITPPGDVTGKWALYIENAEGRVGQLDDAFSVLPST